MIKSLWVWLKTRGLTLWLDIIASDAFFQLVIDGMAYLCWPFIAKVFDLHPNMEVYSGYHPAWILAHATPLWQNGLTDEKIIPTLKELYTFHPDVDFNILPYEEVNALPGYVYPEVIDQSGFASAMVHLCVNCDKSPGLIKR